MIEILSKKIQLNITDIRTLKKITIEIQEGSSTTRSEMLSVIFLLCQNVRRIDSPLRKSIPNPDYFLFYDF